MVECEAAEGGGSEPEGNLAPEMVLGDGFVFMRELNVLS